MIQFPPPVLRSRRARRALSAVTAVALVLLAAPLSSLTSAGAATTTGPVVTLLSGVQSCQGDLPTPGSGNTDKRLIGGTLTPGGTAIFEISYPVTATDVGQNFQIRDCVFVNSVAILQYQIDFVPNNTNYVLTYSLAIPASVSLGSDFCNVAKTTQAPSASPATNRKAGPACFRVGGDVQILKRDAATHAVLTGAGFTVACTATQAIPPVVFAGLTGSPVVTNSGLTTTQTGIATTGAIAVAGPSGTACSATETSPPPGYLVASPATQQFVIDATQQLIVNFDDPAAVPNLHIAKSAVPASGSVVDHGQTIVYTLNYWNDGAANATGAVITDQLPTGVTFVSSSPAATVNGTGLVTFTAPVSVAKGTSAGSPAGSVTLTVTVDANVANNVVLTNIAKINAVNSNPVSHTVKFPVLAAQKSASPAPGTPVKPGDTITYAIALQNTGAAPTAAITVTDAIPVGTTYVSGSADNSGSFAANTVTWTIPALAAGGTTTLHFAVTVNQGDTNGQVIQNTAAVNKVNTNTVEHTVKFPVLTSNKTADPVTGSNVSLGQTITYTITVTNSGLAAATNVPVSDAIPVGTTYTANSAKINATPGGTFSAGSLSWTIPSVSASGGTATVSFQVTVDNNLINGDVILNHAVVAGTDSNTTTHTVAFAVLGALKSASPPDGSAVTPGQTITYSIAVHNSGGAPITNVTVTDPIPVGTSYVSGSANHSGSFAANTVTWTIPTLAAGGTITEQFAVTVAQNATNGQVIENTAAVNQVHTNTVRHTVEFAILSSEKSASPASGSTVTLGQVITYTITVQNTGLAAETNVPVSDGIPTGTSYVANSAKINGVAGGTFSAGSLSWTIPSVSASGGTATVSFQVTVNNNVTNGTQILNHAVVAGTDTNTTTHTVSFAIITASKANSPTGSVKPGDSITYTITVNNSGGVGATGVAVSDAIPANTTYGGSTPTGSLAGNTLSWTVDVPAQGSTQVAFTVTVNQGVSNGTLIANTAVVNGTDTNQVSNPVAFAVLGLVKTATPPSGSTVQPGDTIAYTLTVSNTGGAASGPLVVTDPLPANVSLVSGSLPAGVTYDAATRTVTWSLTSLGASATDQVSFSVTVDSSAPDNSTLHNTAVLGDLTSSTDHPVHVPTGTLTLVKTVDHTTANYGDTLAYGLTVGTTGDLSQTHVVVTDVVPTGTTYLTGSATCDGTCTVAYDAASRTVTWSLGSVPTGTTRSLAFKASIDKVAPAANGTTPGESVTNVGSVVSDQQQPTPSNQVVTTVPGSSAVLGIKFSKPPTKVATVLGLKLPFTGVGLPVGDLVGLGILLLVGGSLSLLFTYRPMTSTGRHRHTGRR